MKKPKKWKLSKRKQELKDAKDARREAEVAAAEARSTAEFYKRRFRAFGSNVKTVHDISPDLKCIEWSLKPVQYGNFAVIGNAEQMEHELKRELVERLTEGLIENNLVQVISRTPDSDPFFPGTYAVKLFVVPWECVPHQREVRLKQIVQKTLDEGG